MSTIESNIFEVIKQDQEFWGNLSDTRVELLEGQDLVDRYTGIVELGDTVLRGVMYVGLPAPVHSVTSWKLETAVQAKRAMAEFGGEDPDLAEQEAIQDHLNRRPISHDEARRIVTKKLKKAEAIEEYAGLSKPRRTLEVARFMCGRSSRFVPKFERHRELIPKIISLDVVGQPKAFIIDRQLDEQFQ